MSEGSEKQLIHNHQTEKSKVKEHRYNETNNNIFDKVVIIVPHEKKVKDHGDHQQSQEVLLVCENEDLKQQTDEGYFEDSSKVTRLGSFVDSAVQSSQYFSVLELIFFDL